MSEIVLFDPARLPTPEDETGFFYHPDIPCDPVDPDNEAFDVAGALAAMGFEWAGAQFEFDAPDDLVEAYFEREDLTASARWNPTPPEGDGWILVGKGDSDDGPQALFVRRIQPSPTSATTR